MKILISGIFVFLIWAGLSGWFYVCQIKGLCIETAEAEVIPMTVPPAHEEMVNPDTISGVNVPTPANLVIHFATDRWSVTPGPDIESSCSQFKAWLEKHPTAVIYITGHTDATGSGAYNMALGGKRARAVRDYFVNTGIPAGRIVTASMGEDKPVGNNSTVPGRAKNRRAEVSLNQ